MASGISGRDWNTHSVSRFPEKVLPFIGPSVCVHCGMENRHLESLLLRCKFSLALVKAVGTSLHICERNILKEEWFLSSAGTSAWELVTGCHIMRWVAEPAWMAGQEQGAHVRCAQA